MDIPLLISHILKRLAAVKNRERPEISEGAMAILLNHAYPGNVRELENILEHALIICRGDMITRSHLPIFLQRDHEGPSSMESPAAPLAADMETSEKNMLLSVLKEHHWHRGNAAAALSINRSTLWRKMKKYGLFPK